jgi:hypothetical protein
MIVGRSFFFLSSGYRDADDGKIVVAEKSDIFIF